MNTLLFHMWHNDDDFIQKYNLAIKNDLHEKAILYSFGNTACFVISFLILKENNYYVIDIFFLILLFVKFLQPYLFLLN